MNQASAFRIQRTFAVAAVMAIGVFLPAAAGADVGDRGVISIGVDRLFGFTQSKVTLSSGTAESSNSRTDFSLLVPTTSTAYTTPGLAVDVAVADHVTVGGALGIIVSSTSGTRTVGNLTTETGSLSGTGIVLAPRGGYVLALGSSARLWLRGGFTYFQSSSKGEDSMVETSVNGFALDLEPTFLFNLAPHLAMSVGAVLDLPLGGEVKSTLGGTSQTADAKVRCLGVVAGLVIPL